jgi:hypothetical protein
MSRRKQPARLTPIAQTRIDEVAFVPDRSVEKKIERSAAPLLSGAVIDCSVV